MSRSLGVVFMGTPDFSVPTLKALHESGHRLRLVVTQPDRPKGRGRKVVAPPVKTVAEGFGYPVIQPTAVKTDEFVDRLKSVEPDVLVVIAYGRILIPRVLEIPKIAPVNVHASLLPAYRGPAPIQWAIINGDAETGVTTMRMEAGLDTGDILMTAKEPIYTDDTAATLARRLSKKGAEVLIKTLDALSQDQLKPVAQDDRLATIAPMLNKSDGRIPWQKPAHRIACFIRGMNPWPGAYTFHGEARLKIFNAVPCPSDDTGAPGTVVEGFPDELRVATGDGELSIQEIQAASGKRMSIRDFLRGYQIPPGTRLE